jgi:hypothetical protein
MILKVNNWYSGKIGLDLSCYRYFWPGHLLNYFMVLHYTFMSKYWFYRNLKVIFFYGVFNIMGRRAKSEERREKS